MSTGGWKHLDVHHGWILLDTVEVQCPLEVLWLTMRTLEVAGIGGAVELKP